MGNKSSSNITSSYPQHDDPAYKKCQELKVNYHQRRVIHSEMPINYMHKSSLQMERWIQMHYQIKEREEAIAIARNRELFYWVSGFYITSLFGCFSFYQRTRRAAVLLPMVPLSFVMGYYADLAYGSKIHRIKGDYQ